MRNHWPTTATVAALLALTATAQACPMCKDGVTVAQPTTGPTVAAAAAAPLDFNTSIYAMLGVVAVVGTLAGRAMVKAVRG